MNTLELTRYALSFAFDILEQVVADLTQEQADWTPPGTVSTIGAIYSHVITYVDFILQEVCIAQSDAVFAEPPLEEIRMQDVQVELSTLHAYADEVKTTLHDWLSSLTPEDLEREMETSLGELNLGQLLEVYIIWHINVHCGEISALKGCQGLKGYPW
jgi:hypothetical protein